MIEATWKIYTDAYMIFNLYELSRKKANTEIRNRLGALGWAWKWEVTVNGDKVSFGENVLEFDSGDGCTMLSIY